MPDLRYYELSLTNISIYFTLFSFSYSYIEIHTHNKYLYLFSD